MHYWKLSLIIAALSLIIGISGCDFGGTSPTAKFVVTPVAGLPGFEVTPGSGTPIPFTRDGRSQTALASYRIAYEAAKERFSPDAKLYAIMPSAIMIGNLGGPPVRLGWFYEFKLPDSRRMFIVQIVDGVVSGTTQAEAIADVKPTELPIDLSTVKLDSPQVFEKFGTIAAQRGIDIGNNVYDLELINAEGGSGPVWSVVDPMTLKWLYSMHATTGEEVRDPHQ